MSVSRSSGWTARQEASKSKSPGGLASSAPPASSSTTITWSTPWSARTRSSKARSVTAMRAPASSTWYWICSVVYVL